MMEVRLGDFVGVWHFDGGLRLDGPCVPDQDLQGGEGGRGVGDGQGEISFSVASFFSIKSFCNMTCRF